jgi:small subunit ribosomal protein S10
VSKIDDFTSEKTKKALTLGVVRAIITYLQKVYSKKESSIMEKIRLKLKAYDHRVLDKSVSAILEAVKRSGAELIGPIPMPTKIKRYTVLKSPHVNKKSREQFEMRIHGRVIDIVSATSETVDLLMKIDLAPEVDVEVRSMSKGN